VRAVFENPTLPNKGFGGDIDISNQEIEAEANG
jgi:hypothetical protein